jgi:hypothetical protein
VNHPRISLPLRCALLALAALLAAPAPRPAAAASTETIGGPGGAPFRVACGGGRYLVGLTGRSGSWIDQVAPVCVRLVGSRWTDVPRVGPAVGGETGVAFTMLCPTDHVVTGFYGYAQDYVINIGLNCRRDGAGGPHWSPSVPARVGGAAGVSSSAGGGCGPGAAADGIVGGAGLYVDRLGLSCATYLPPAEPVPEPQTSGVGIEDMSAVQPCAFCKEQAFMDPTVEGAAVDVCLNWGTNCGKPAADAFCQLQGFAGSSAHAARPNAPPTFVIGDRAVCRESYCARLTSITCVR